MLANPSITGILSLECCSTPAAGTWVERNKATDKVKVVGFDLLDQTVQLVQKGDIQATIDQAPEKQGFEAVDLLVKFLNGQADRQRRHRRESLHQGQHRRGRQEVRRSATKAWPTRGPSRVERHDGSPSSAHRRDCRGDQAVPRRSRARITFPSAFARGEVHAVIGENGAGKSTLMNILAGEFQPDEGKLRVDGKTMRFASPLDSRAAGIVVVYQELALCPTLSVAENIMMSDMAARPVVSLVPRAAMRTRGARGARQARHGQSRSRRQGRAGSRSPRCNWSRSPPRSDSAPECSCSTSRTPRFPSARASGCSMSSGNCEARASPSSTSRTASRRCSTSPIASRSCATAGIVETLDKRQRPGRSLDTRHGRPRPGQRASHGPSKAQSGRCADVVLAVENLTAPGAQRDQLRGPRRRDSRDRRPAGFRQGRAWRGVVRSSATGAAASRLTARSCARPTRTPRSGLGCRSCPPIGAARAAC